MAPPVTELATLPLKAGTDVSDPNTTAGTVWQDTLNEVLSQPGAQRAYWGTQVENPGILMLYVDWETHDAHKQFMATPAYGPFVKRLLSLLDDGPSLYHAPLTPHPATNALSDTRAGATENLQVYFPASYSQASQDTFAAAAKKLTDAIDGATDSGMTGAAGGWVIEDVPYAKAEGGKAKLFQAVLGWTSVEAHMKFRETETFKENIHLLRDAEGMLGFDVFHVKFLEVQGELGGEERGKAATDARGEILNTEAGGKSKPKTTADGTTMKNA